jgi:tetratricopeptide (TPR) repeat protein
LEPAGPRKAPRLDEGVALVEAATRLVGAADVDGRLRGCEVDVRMQRGAWYGYLCKEHGEPRNFARASIDLRAAIRLNPALWKARDRWAKALVHEADDLPLNERKCRRWLTLARALAVLQDGLRLERGELVQGMQFTLEAFQEALSYALSTSDISRLIRSGTAGAADIQRLMTEGAALFERREFVHAILVFVNVLRREPTHDDAMRRLRRALAAEVRRRRRHV